MNASVSELNTALEHLKLDVANLNVLRKLTREQERRVMGEVFVWWQRAKEIEGYLEKCYLENNIVFNRTQGEVNFRPLLRLVTDNQITENDLDTWAKVLPKILEDVTRSPNHYASKPQEKIAHFIQQKGGKRALAGYYSSKTAINEPISNSEMVAEVFFTLADAEFIPTLQLESRKHYEESNANPELTLPTVKATQDGYSIVLVKQTNNGTELIGSVDRAELIDELLINTYRNDFEAVPLTLRSVLEPVHILNVPKSLAKNADKFIELSNLKDAWNVGKKELAVKRLIYRPASKDFLLSCMQVPSAVVVIAKPHSVLMERDLGDTFLSNSIRQSIEANLLHQSMFNLFDVSEKEKFRETKVPGISAHSISLKTKLEIPDSNDVKGSKVVQRTTNLNHSPISFIPFYEMLGEPRWQVINKPDDFTPTWTALLDLNWIRAACNQFFEQWVTHYGNKAKRDINLVTFLTANNDQLKIGFEYEANAGFDNLKLLDFGSRKAKGKVALHLRSSDFSFVMRQIADLNVIGELKIKADENVLFLSFSTSASKYECWIPACDLSGNRSSKHFTIYSPVQSENLIILKDPTEEPDFTEQEKDALLKNIQRIKLNERT
jgi:hypothetical protein